MTQTKKPAPPAPGRMTLVFSGNNYIHKALVVAAEAGVLDRLDFVVNNPIVEGAAIWDYSPLGRHPVLQLDDGLVLYSGLILCEYLDSLNPDPAKRLYPQSAARWAALTFMVLGDGLFDAVSALSTDTQRPASERKTVEMLRNRQRIFASLDQLEADAPRFADQPFHIGHACIAGGLSFLDRRGPLQKLLIEPSDASFDWRLGHPRLLAWYDRIKDRPSLKLRPHDLGVVGTEKKKD